MIKYFSAFSGMGTDTFVFKRHNIDAECVGWSESYKYAQQFHNNNHPECKDKLYPDMRKVNWVEVPDFDLLTGGFPCTPFSNIGKKAGLNDTKGTLFFSLILALINKRPKAFLFENVKGILGIQNGEAHKLITKLIDEAGYNLQVEVLNTRDYGIPQNRERVWYIGLRKDLQGLPLNIPKPFNMRKITDFLQSSSELNLKYTIPESGWYRDNYEYHKQQILNKYGKIDDIWVADLSQSKHRASVMKGISSTFRYSHSGFALIDLNRRLSPTEVFRLQGFNDAELNINGLSDTQLYRLAGNGWSINVAEILLNQLVLLIGNQ